MSEEHSLGVRMGRGETTIYLRAESSGLELPDALGGSVGIVPAGGVIAEYTRDRGGPRRLAFRITEAGARAGQVVESVASLDLRVPANRAVAERLLRVRAPWPPAVARDLHAVLRPHRASRHGRAQRLRGRGPLRRVRAGRPPRRRVRRRDRQDQGRPAPRGGLGVDAPDRKNACVRTVSRSHSEAAITCPTRGVPRRRPDPRGARPARAALHRPGRAGVRARPTCPRRSRGRCSPATRATRHAAPPVPRGVRGLAAGWRRASTVTRVAARRSSTSGSSSATGTTRSPSSAARTSPASGRRTSSPRSSSARGSAPTSSSRRATSPTTRRCRAARARRRGGGAALPLLPGPAARPGVRGRDGLPVRDLRGQPPARARVGGRDVPAHRGRGARRARPGGQRQGAGPAARPAARRVAVAHGHLRHRPGLRAADPAPDRPPAARGAPLRRADPRRDQGGDAELRRARRAAGPRRRVGLVPAGPAQGRRALDRPARARARGRGGGPAVGPAAARGRRRGPAARRAAVRGGRHLRGAHAGGRRRARRRRARADAGRPRRASGPTAATAPAAASRRSATGSRSCPTTARSATSSATGC